MNLKNEIFSSVIFIFLLLLIVMPGCEKESETINQPPTCEFLWPAHGQEFLKGRIVSVNIGADDPDDTITSVHIYVDGQEMKVLTSFPYKFYLDTKDLAEGNRTIRATAVDLYGKTGSSSIALKILVENIKPCPGMDSISYGGQIYHTVLIGSQCWLKENLNIGTMVYHLHDQQDNGIIEKYCAYNDTNKCKKYGGLYQWDEMMAYETALGSQGICPDGWHVPNDEEWKLLQGTVDSHYGYPNDVWQGISWCGHDVSDRLKSRDEWDILGYGTDLYGFNAIPAGIRIGNGIGKTGREANFWTSSDYSFEEGTAWFRHMVYDSDKIYRYHFDKRYGLSVRCLRDY